MSCLMQCAATLDTSRTACTDAFRTCLSNCPLPTPRPQCSGDQCGGPCLTSPTCPAGEACPAFARLGQCVADSTGACGCSVPSPQPTATPQCSEAMCGGACTIDIPFPCQEGKICNGPDIPALQGNCTSTADGDCHCVPVRPTPATPLPTRTPQCGGSMCGGTCVFSPTCPPGALCPEASFVVRPGECMAAASGACECVPVTPTPECTSDTDCDDGNACTADRCVHGVCDHGCICLTSAGLPGCCGGPSETCVAPCGSDANGSCGGFCPAGGSCESVSGATAGCGCVSGPGGPCGGNILNPPPVCAPGLVCRQILPDVVGQCENPGCVPLFSSGCTETADCCQPCGNGTGPPCGVCLHGTCVGAP
jgi:hypothetical protein